MYVSTLFKGIVKSGIFSYTLYFTIMAKRKRTPTIYVFCHKFIRLDNRSTVVLYVTNCFDELFYVCKNVKIHFTTFMKYR